MQDELLTLRVALKKQSLELEKRGQFIMKLEEELREYKKCVLAIATENKKLEILLEALREERQRFLEENSSLENEIRKNKDLTSAAQV